MYSDSGEFIVAWWFSRFGPLIDEDSLIRLCRQSLELIASVVMCVLITFGYLLPQTIAKTHG
jgi:hypothetical protein